MVREETQKFDDIEPNDNLNRELLSSLGELVPDGDLKTGLLAVVGPNDPFIDSPARTYPCK